MKNNMKENNEKVNQTIFKNNNASSLTDSLIGILKEDESLDEIKDEYINKKYGLTSSNKN
jgi:hypothetical protein